MALLHAESGVDLLKPFDTTRFPSISFVHKQLTNRSAGGAILNYHAPDSLGEALEIMALGGGDSSGGWNRFLSRDGAGWPRQSLLDLTRIKDLRGIVRDGDQWRIGAATRWSDILQADLPAAFDGLKAAAREVGSVQIQNAGTVAGNLCNASPAADGVPPLLVLDAEVELVSAAGTRRMPLTDFLTGVRQTALAPDELMIGLYLPIPPRALWGVFSKLGTRRYLVISIAMTAALLRLDSKGRFDIARIAVGACSPVALRLTALEAALIGQKPGDVDITQEHLAPPLSPIDDVRGTAGYRLESAREMLARLICEGWNG